MYDDGTSAHHDLTIDPKEAIIVKLSEKKVLWLIYTVLFGMVPIFIRIFVACMVNGDKVPLISAADFISLGIVMQISILAEIRYNESSQAGWKQALIGISVLAIIFYAALFAFALLGEVNPDINQNAVLGMSILMSLGSFLLCWAVYDRIIHSSTSVEEAIV
ncbi:hypothetical protein [Pseudomonas violetae]|uniref:Transmembrane protein n=1 Tax=Pseudomonas violetae TaxID=2915813 RepID=A0ABT0F8M2_9PSED|nr:hypothetical protein [Pseudomonas violetae]MCK1794293.1 hypothetical protein [Pseudomonas violetae]